jgi:tight adherence protein B
MIELAAAVSAFTAVTGLALYMFTGAPGRRGVEQRLSTLTQGANSDDVDPSGVLRRESGTFPFLRAFLIKSGRAERAAIELQQAGLALKASEYYLLRMLLATLAFVLVLLLFRGSLWGLAFCTIGCVVGFMIPAWYASWLRSRRIIQINSQLVEGLQLISNALRSGFAFTQSVEMAVRQLQSPLKDEFERFLQDNALGSKTDEALHSLVVRTGSYDIEMMVTVILVQRTTGGNLSEILDNVAETIRERERLQGEIRALTSQQRLTGRVLALYPILLGVLFTAVAYDLMKVLWEEEFGRILLFTAGIFQILGFLVISRILRLDV